MTGKNQSYARLLNNRMVIAELRKEPCSATMLSRRLKLSPAALSAIIGELKKKNCIKEVSACSAVEAVGRRPVYYAINEKFGSVAAVSLYGNSAKVVLADVCTNVLYTEEIRVEKFDIATLYESVLMLKNALAREECRDYPLLGIELSMPGRVNTLTGELILSKQFSTDMYDEHDKVTSLFARQFNVPVSMSNDINLACIGEMKKGLLSGVDNGMLVYVDIGIGGAFVLDGRLFTGARGFAGEVGLMTAHFGGSANFLDEFVSLRAIKDAVGKKIGKKVHTADLLQLYKSDQWVRNYVLRTARCLGEALKDAVELLDVSRIVVSGRVTEFGEEYFAQLNGEVGKSVENCSVLPSSLGSDANVIGAIHRAVENLTDKLFE